MYNKKALILDAETVPIIHSGISNNLKIITEEYNAKIAKKRIQTNDPDIDFLPEPQFNSIVAIALREVELKNHNWIYVKQYVLTIKDRDEKSLIKDIVSVINSVDNDLYVHFNGLNFDIPLIQYKSIIYDLPILQKRFNNTYKYSMSPHYDLMHAVNNYGVFGINFRTLASDLGLGDPKSETDGSKILDLYLNKDFDSIATYVESDTEYNHSCLNKLWKFRPVEVWR